MIHIGDCIATMAGMASDRFDAIVTDPPYGIGFMGKAWDGADITKRMEQRRAMPSADPSCTAQGGHRSAAAAAGLYDLSPRGMRAFQDFSRDWAIEALRVLKPGGYTVVFASPRTYHRMVCGIEEAGFEIRDTLMWVFGSGFPKSRNGDWGGTALKPGYEPILLARKPLAGSLAVNHALHGTGGLNIDGCRVEAEPMAPNTGAGGLPRRHAHEARGPGHVSQPHALGRWPANLLHDGSTEVLRAFPNAPGQQAAISTGAPSEKTANVYGRMRREHEDSRDSENDGPVGFRMKPGARRLDAGSAARFFYCAKASSEDRNEGCEDMPATLFGMSGGAAASIEAGGDVDETSTLGMNRVKERRNNHPTVKPTELMRWLCRLVTPAGGLVLDPFTGSGSTGRAAVLEGMRFEGIELDPGYAEIARKRIWAAQPGLPLAMPA